MYWSVCVPKMRQKGSHNGQQGNAEANRHMEVIFRVKRDTRFSTSFTVCSRHHEQRYTRSLAVFLDL